MAGRGRGPRHGDPLCHCRTVPAAGALERQLDEFALDVADELGEIEALFRQRQRGGRRGLWRGLHLRRQIGDIDMCAARSIAFSSWRTLPGQ